MSGATKQTSTPGPWEVVGHGVYTVADNPCREILWHGHNTRSAPDKEREANAHLIAAAPELLAALRAARDLLASLPPDLLELETMAAVDTTLDIDDAIHKAEGGAS